jgi:4-hydroxy-2-oxoheptanedioate aldolase
MAAGKPILGLQLLVHHPAVVEVAGWCGADYVIVDGEHAVISPVGLEAIVRAAEIAGIVPVIRTFVNHGSDLLPYLDLGFRGVMVPHLKTAAQATELVKFTRFPPSGERSITPGRVSRYFATPQTAQDLERLSSEILIIAQIEDAEAVENIESILDVDGIDIYNVGPADLSASLGYPINPEAPSNPSHPEIRAIIVKIAEAAARKGRYTTNRGWSSESQQEFFMKNARNFFLADTDILARSIRAKAAELGRLGTS